MRFSACTMSNRHISISPKGVSLDVVAALGEELRLRLRFAQSPLNVNHTSRNRDGFSASTLREATGLVLQDSAGQSASSIVAGTPVHSLALSCTSRYKISCFPRTQEKMLIQECCFQKTMLAWSSKQTARQFLEAGTVLIGLFFRGRT